MEKLIRISIVITIILCLATIMMVKNQNNLSKEDIREVVIDVLENYQPEIIE